MIVQVLRADQMPVDEHGNRVDIIFAGEATVNRMNIGRKYEQYTNAASRDVRKKIMRDLMTDPSSGLANEFPVAEGLLGHQEVNQKLAEVAKDRHLTEKLEKYRQVNADGFNKVWSYLMGYYQIINEKQANWFNSSQYKGSYVDHLANILKSHVFLYCPPELEKPWPEIIREIEQFYPPVYGPVTYRGNSGRLVTTRSKIRVGSMYIILLEKTADDWTAVSSAKTQINGVLAQITNSDKYAQPWRNQAIRAYGESEVRIFVSYVGALETANILDRNNNPEAHKAALYAIYGAKQPTNIFNAVDRIKVPMGGSKPLQLINHILEVGGTRMVYQPYIPQWNTDPVPLIPLEGVNA